MLIIKSRGSSYNFYLYFSEVLNLLIMFLNNSIFFIFIYNYWFFKNFL